MTTLKTNLEIIETEVLTREVLVQNLVDSTKAIATKKTENYNDYIALLEDYTAMSKKERKDFCSPIATQCNVFPKTILDNFQFLLTAKGLDINPSKFSNFFQLKNANKNAKSEGYKVPKSGVNKGIPTISGAKAKEVANARNESIKTIQAVNKNEVSQLLNDATFQAFKKSFAENDYKLANIMKALKS